MYRLTIMDTNLFVLLGGLQEVVWTMSNLKWTKPTNIISVKQMYPMYTQADIHNYMYESLGSAAIKLFNCC